jgi:hypothetical protein
MGDVPLKALIDPWTHVIAACIEAEIEGRWPWQRSGGNERERSRSGFDGHSGANGAPSALPREPYKKLMKRHGRLKLS